MFARTSAKRRIEFLTTGAPATRVHFPTEQRVSPSSDARIVGDSSYQSIERSSVRNDKWLSSLMKQADLSISPLVFLSLVVASGGLSLFIASRFVSIYVAPFFFVIGALLPFRWVSAKATKRAVEFSSDYPSIVLATAASMKAGMTVFSALERSVQLFPETSLVRQEVLALLERMRRGERPEVAVKNFGSGVYQPEIVLFRTAFVLALENGGKFAPTLERLAAVTRDRSLLVQSARVSTTTMRMTANALLVLAPIILAMIAVRTEGFWDILIHNPVSNTLASIGVVVILASYLILQRMSGFKP